ncbi:MAG TPA: DUF2474 domain-containing protein [Caulobacterales bacterium]|nr:DUF2474 domain-containing protein [Caulobacterales bacterium]
MPRIIEGPPEGDAPAPPLAKRLGWFVLIWVGSLVAVGAAAYGLRALIM